MLITDLLSKEFRHLVEDVSHLVLDVVVGPALVMAFDAIRGDDNLPLGPGGVVVVLLAI